MAQIVNTDIFNACSLTCPSKSSLQRFVRRAHDALSGISRPELTQGLESARRQWHIARAIFPVREMEYLSRPVHIAPGGVENGFAHAHRSLAKQHDDRRKHAIARRLQRLVELLLFVH
ncbi:MAG: hypothetical protein BGO22_17615 [Hydrogenophaga sp. 70-12]|nr:MAG: hypothetical protein BGO22_17615 [Hydrogenophaga sp. 70-12]